MRLTFLGDVMMDKEQLHYFCKDGEFNFTDCFSGIQEYIKKSDYVIANLETPIAGEDLQYTKELYSFNSPVQFAEALKMTGVHCVTTANNHCLDRGIDGLKKTVDNLELLGLDFMGTHKKMEDSFIIREIDGIKVGLFAFTYGTNAFSNKQYMPKDKYFYVDMLQNQELANPFVRRVYLNNRFPFRVVRKICRMIKVGQFDVQIYERREQNKKCLTYYAETIRKCKEAGAEYIVSCLHVGGQYNEIPSQYTKEMCELSLHLGVDAVIANHEHVIHKIDTNHGFCIYSLGNLLSSNGILEPPHDKKSEYSVGISIELNRSNTDINKIMVKYYFSLFHSFVKEDGKVVCGLLYDSIKNCKDEERRKLLLRTNNELVNILMDTKNVSYPLAREYEYEI